MLPSTVNIDEQENTHSEQALPVQVFCIGKLPFHGLGTYPNRVRPLSTTQTHQSSIKKLKPVLLKH